MTFFSCRLLTTPIFPLRRLSSVLSKFSHKNTILFGCHSPLDGVTRGGPPSDATANVSRYKVYIYTSLFTQSVATNKTKK